MVRIHMLSLLNVYKLLQIAKRTWDKIKSAGGLPATGFFQPEKVGGDLLKKY